MVSRVVGAAVVSAAGGSGWGWVSASNQQRLTGNIDWGQVAIDTVTGAAVIVISNIYEL